MNIGILKIRGAGIEVLEELERQLTFEEAVELYAPIADEVCSIEIVLSFGSFEFISSDYCVMASRLASVWYVELKKMKDWWCYSLKRCGVKGRDGVEKLGEIVQRQ